jgi:nicotinate-nucleotide adenylyltransferase
MASSIGILGGTFNPPHVGHLALARHAREELGLELVVLMPVHAPHKDSVSDPGPEHRLAMCRLATEDQPGMSTCSLEVRRGGPSFTADTLAEIHASHPQAELTFIVGADTARTLPSWHEPARVMRLARLAIADREGAEHEQVLSALASIGGGGESLEGDPSAPHFLAMSPIDASSSLIRSRVAEGAAIEDLVGRAVAGYIAEHRLYKTEEEVS